MRVTDWAETLSAAVERHAAMPFEWGVSDCLYLPADAILAVTGEDRLAAYRGYTTKAGAARMIVRNGYATIADGFAHHFEEIPPALAQRGDIGVIDRGGETAGGVFTLVGFAAKSETGVLFEPVTAVQRAFRVE